jgi:hypothetical protein
MRAMPRPFWWFLTALFVLIARPTFALDLRAPALNHSTKPLRLIAPGSGGDTAPLLLSPLTMKEFGAGVGAATIMVPGSLALGTWLGSLSSNLYAATLPSMLLFLTLPPLAVTFSEWLMGRQLGDSLRWGPALGVGIGVQLLLTMSAFLFGVSTNDLGAAALFSLAEILVLPAAITLTMHFSRPTASPAVTPMPITPVATTTSDRFNGVVVPLASAAF